MKFQLKSVILGFVLGCIFTIGAIFCFLFLGSTGGRPVFVQQKLASGQTVKVTSFNLVWGVEHDERHSGDDQLQMEYVSAFPDGDDEGREKELLQAFELIRPASEQWGFDKATVSAFPTLVRKGKYDHYYFTRSAGGAWTFTRKPAKVFSND